MTIEANLVEKNGEAIRRANKVIRKKKPKRRTKIGGRHELISVCVSLQQLYIACKDVFQGPGTVPSSQDVQKLQHILDTLRPEDVGLSSEMLFFKPRDVMKGTPTVTYTTIYQCKNFSLCIFFLPPTALIPLHNHPEMTVFSKLLLGSMHIKSYDWVDPCTSDDSLPPRSRLARMNENSVFTAPCDTSVLYPTSGGNIHAFKAVTACAVLDLLGPPYSKDDGRDCTYYREYPYSICSEPPNVEPWTVDATRSEKVDTFCKLSNAEKKKVCQRLPLAWKLFPDPTSGEGEVPDEQLAGEEAATADQGPIDLEDSVVGDMTKKKGTVMDQLLATNQSKVGLPSASSGKNVQAGLSIQKKQPVKSIVAKVPLPSEPKKRALEEVEVPLTKRSKADDPVRPELIDSNGKGIPAYLYAFHNVTLVGRLMGANILSHDYDKCMELATESRKEIFTRFRYKLYVLEAVERDCLELEAGKADRLKKEAEEAISTRDELQKAKYDTEKLATEADLAKKSLLEELDRVKADLVDLQKSSAAVAGERDRLNGEVDKLKADKTECLDAKVLAETKLQVKDIYLSYLAFLLEPPLGLLPADVSNEIKCMPGVFGVEVVPQKYDLPEGAAEGDEEAGVEDGDVE